MKIMLIIENAEQLCDMFLRVNLPSYLHKFMCSVLYLYTKYRKMYNFLRSNATNLKLTLSEIVCLET